ncbi:MAG: class I SAM-dependent methyltransferase, partial [Bdellovibrionota bacterium]
MTDRPESISETALWVAYYRAIETERPDAHFHDPYARLLAGKRGEEIARSLFGGQRHYWSLVVRTTVMDRMIMEGVNTRGFDTVLNLGAGLDTRPYRLKLPPGTRWIEVDLPPLLAYKEKLLAHEHSQVASLERVKLNLGDVTERRALFDRIGASSASKVLVLTEGLLMYLKPEQVDELARDLLAQPRFCAWVFDYIDPRVLRLIDRIFGKKLEKMDARMHFAPEEGPHYFEKLGWKCEELVPFIDEARRLGREPVLYWAWKAVSPFVSAARREQVRRANGIARL